MKKYRSRTPTEFLGGVFKKKEEFHTGVHNLTMTRIWSLEIFLRLLPPPTRPRDPRNSSENAILYRH